MAPESLEGQGSRGPPALELVRGVGGGPEAEGLVGMGSEGRVLRPQSPHEGVPP